jgi:hypothetical protein
LATSLVTWCGAARGSGMGRSPLRQRSSLQPLLSHWEVGGSVTNVPVLPQTSPTVTPSTRCGRHRIVAQGVAPGRARSPRFPNPGRLVVHRPATGVARQLRRPGPDVHRDRVGHVHRRGPYRRVRLIEHAGTAPLALPGGAVPVGSDSLLLFDCNRLPCGLKFLPLAVEGALYGCLSSRSRL